MHIIARLNVGGAAASAILTVRHLRDDGDEVLLVCGHVGADEGDMAYLADAHAITPHYVPSLGRAISPLNDIRAIWTLIRLIRRFKPDVVHTHTAKAGFVGRVAAWIARVPVRVHTLHGHVFRGYFSPRKTQIYLTLERLCARISTRVITISDSLRDELVDDYRVAPPERFAVLPVGFDLMPLTQRPPQAEIDAHGDAHGIPPDKRLVGIVGRLVPIKNHALFLEAAAIIAGRHADAHFVIAGDGEMRGTLEARTRALGLEARVTFTGWIQDTRAVFHALDVMMMTSTNEGTPVSIIEAMAAGVPVVATDVGGVRDVLDGGGLGYVVAPDDALMLAESVCRVLDGDLPDVEAARAFALAHYDIAARARELRAFYVACGASG